MLPYDLTPSAIKDLESIATYTIDTWGQKQADKYANQLAACFNQIAKKQVFTRQFSNRMPKIKYVKCERHYVFYTHSQCERPTIIAVLYERMDLLNRLSTRL